MEKPKRIVLILIVLTLMFASICGIKAHASPENTQTFFDSGIPGITIQVNATSETSPNQNITMSLSLRRQTNVGVYVGYFNIDIFGFLNGTYKTLLYNITDTNFVLSDPPKEYNRTCTFLVPAQVWDATYAGITLTYNATYSFGYGNLQFPYNITLGFIMTHVDNVYLTGLQAQNVRLQQNYTALQGNLSDLQENYSHLQQNYTALQGKLSDLDNTRSAVAVLAITSIFFLATTVYLIMRKPKDYY